MTWYALLTLTLALALTGPAMAATLFVTDCGDTLPGGVGGQLRRLITEASPLDTIVIPACTIILAGAANDDANQSGDLDINKELTLQGAGPGRTILDGGGVDRVLHVNVAVVVTVSRLTIRNGNTLANGGGILNLGNLTVEDATISGNTGANGGGIANFGTLNLERSTIAGNTATSNGGGIFTTATSVILAENSTISGNSANGAGGGVFSNSTGDVRLFSMTVTQNRADANNAMGGSGGGLRIAAGMPKVDVTILAGNTVGASGTDPDCSGTIDADSGYNLIQNTTGCTLSGSTTGNVIGFDPLLGPLQDNGGFTETHALLPGSPAIDATIPGESSRKDQRGFPRAIDGNNNGPVVQDIGAYELFPSTASLGLALNQSSFAVGDVLVAAATVTNPGPALPVDVYFGAVFPASAGPALGCPGGDAVAFLAGGFSQIAIQCLSGPPEAFPALVKKLALPVLAPTSIPGFFVFAWPPDAPPGVYTFFLALTPPGAFLDGKMDAVDILTVAVAGATFAH